MAVLVGETKTRSWYGKKFTFERVAKGEWRCTYKESQVIPEAILSEIKQWT